MSEYFRICRDPDARRRQLRFHRIGSLPDLDLEWLVGARFGQAPPTPIRVELAPGPEALLPDAFLFDQIPLFSGRFLSCLQSAGVDNVDRYRAQIVSAEGEPVDTEFHAVNIVGLIAAVDAARSRAHPLSAYPMLEFEHLVVDEAAVGANRLFRLADNPSFILVNRAVRDAMEGAGLVNVRALSLDDRLAY